jgi:hypothetical protein
MNLSTSIFYVLVTGGVNANESGVAGNIDDEQTMEQVISSLSAFAIDVHLTFENITAKISKEFVDFKKLQDEVNCIVKNLRDLKRKGEKKVIKVGVKRAYDQYEVLDSKIGYAVQALNDFLKNRNYENGRVLVERARKLPDTIEKILNLFNGGSTDESNLLVAFQYNHDVSQVYL